VEQNRAQVRVARACLTRRAEMAQRNQWRRESVCLCVCVCEQRGGGQMMSATQMVTMSPLGKIPGATATGAA
jgi:hypothetical protein